MIDLLANLTFEQAIEAFKDLNNDPYLRFVIEYSSDGFFPDDEHNVYKWGVFAYFYDHDQFYGLGDNIPQAVRNARLRYESFKDSETYQSFA